MCLMHPMPILPASALAAEESDRHTSLHVEPHANAQQCCRKSASLNPPTMQTYSDSPELSATQRLPRTYDSPGRSVLMTVTSLWFCFLHSLRHRPLPSGAHLSHCIHVEHASSSLDCVHLQAIICCALQVSADMLDCLPCCLCSLLHECRKALCDVLHVWPVRCYVEKFPHTTPEQCCLLLS